MQEQDPNSNAKHTYKIKYLQCKQKDHQEQKMNFVCLQKSCAQKSLICSMCRHDQHLNHTIKPLKFYLEELKQQYHHQEVKDQLDLQYLQSVKFDFFMKLKEAVEKIAHEFQKLQKTVIQQFQALQNQIRQNSSKRKLFDDLYLSLTSQKSQGNPQQIMKLYLPQKKIRQVSNVDQITLTSQTIVKDIANLKNILIAQQASSFQMKQSNELPLKNDLYIFPSNITKNINCFSQTDFTKDSMIVLNTNVAQLKGTIRFKITQVYGDVKLTLGIIHMDHFNSMNYNWIENTNNSISWVSSNGKFQNMNFSYLGNFCFKGAQIDVRYKKGHVKFVNKKNITDHILYGDAKKFFIFFSMKGSLKLEILYPI